MYHYERDCNESSLMENRRNDNRNIDEYDTSDQQSPEVKVQNYFTDTKAARKKSYHCCKVCKANWEFVTLLIICIVVWGGCLTLYVRCEMDKSKLFGMNSMYNASNTTEVQRDSLDMKG